jgi:plasmid stabilization system protein ParE
VLEALADVQARRIAQTVRLLRTFPQIGASIRYPGGQDMRRVLAGGWSVVYTYDAERDLVTVFMLRPPRVGWSSELG